MRDEGLLMKRGKGRRVKREGEIGNEWKERRERKESRESEANGQRHKGKVKGRR